MFHAYVVNARFVTQPLTGVQRYCYELSLRLRDGTPIAPRPALAEYRELRSRLIVTGGFLTGHPWEQLALPRLVARREILFSPSGCGPVTHRNHVVTIHDVAPLEHPDWYSRGFALWYSQLVPALARSARKIVTVSQYCKRHIIQSLRLAENKVIVAGEAAGASFSVRPQEEVKRTLDRFGLREPYFLAVGAISRRKNLGRLLAAWRCVSGDVEGSLVIVGKERLRFAGGSVLQELPARVLHLPSVGDHDLACLYTGAQGLLYPSLHEGFGLPILEAMACGCPVLASNCTAMPETAGDAAILVDPLSEASIAEGIRRLTHPERAQALRSLGFKRCREFSWAHTARIVEDAILA